MFAGGKQSLPQRHVGSSLESGTGWGWAPPGYTPLCKGGRITGRRDIRRDPVFLFVLLVKLKSYSNVCVPAGETRLLQQRYLDVVSSVAQVKGKLSSHVLRHSSLFQ